MFQSMIEILTLYNDLFSSLGVDLKIVLELRNKERIFNNSLTRQITHTHKKTFLTLTEGPESWNGDLEH